MPSHDATVAKVADKNAVALFCQIDFQSRALQKLFQPINLKTAAFGLSQQRESTTST